MMQLVIHSATASQWSQAQYERVLRKETRPGLTLVIEEENIVRGFLVAHEVAGEWEIENIAVAAAARRRGMGTRLLGEFLDRVRSHGGTCVFLEVRESNRSAQALYLSRGFRAVGQRAAYYRNPKEDALVLRLALAQSA